MICSEVCGYKSGYKKDYKRGCKTRIKKQETGTKKHRWIVSRAE